MDPQFDVFDNQDIDVSTETIFNYDSYPSEPYETNASNIRFSLKAQADYWIKWGSIKLHTEARITTQDPGSSVWKNLDVDDRVIFANNSIHSAFRDIKVELNKNAVDGGNGLYPLLAYVNNTLQYGVTSKTTHMLTQGFHTPTDLMQATFNKGADHSKISYKEELVEWTKEEHETNKTLIEETKTSKWVTFESPLKIPLFNQGKHLPPGFQIDLEFFRSDPRFSLVVFNRKTSGSKFRIEFRNMKLVVPYVRARRSLLTQIERQRQQGKEILYQYNDLDCKRHTIPANTPSWRFPNPFQGRQPKLALAAFVPITQFLTEEKRPLVFSNQNLKTVELEVGGRKIGGRELNCQDITEAYSRFNEALNLFDSNEDCGIDINQFKKYTFFAAFDCTSNDHPEDLQTATRMEYDIEVKFASIVSHAVDMYLFFTFDNKVVLKNDNHVLSGDQIQPEQEFIAPAIKRRRYG